MVTAALALSLLGPGAASAAPPAVKATWATEVNATSFRARGLIDTGQLNTTYRFDYIASATYEANVEGGKDGFSGALHAPVAGEPKVLGTTVDQEVAQRVGGLEPQTSYRFRLAAKNTDGPSVGAVRTVTTQEPSFSFSLPENRGWEMVSPVDKNGGQIAAPGQLLGGGDLQAAAQGGAVTYGSSSSFAGAEGAPGASQYLSLRTAEGWSTRNLTSSTIAGAFGPEPDGVPYRLFSTDLSRALALSNPHAFELLSLGTPLSSLGSLSTQDLRFAGASENLGSVVFSTCAALTAEATEVPAVGGGCDPAFPNLYVREAGTLRLVNLAPGATTGTPGAALAAQTASISADGSRVYWVDDSGALLLRDGNRSLLLDPAGSFQAASADGSVAYFTKTSHLFRYSLDSESSTDLTPAGGVEGVLGVSDSGDRVYYLDGSGLTMWHAGSAKPVAADADPSNFPPAVGTARVSTDGTRLAFLSAAPLTGYDPEGATQVYRYNATTDSLLCVSCNPYGARPLGPSLIPGALANGNEVAAYKARAMDSTGSRLFFDSDDALVPGDSNGEQDVYEWRAQGVAGCAKGNGCLGLLSSGKGENGSSFVDASANGVDAFFLAGDSLVPTDPGSIDLYDARVGGGFPPPPMPIPCFGDDCQPLPPEPDDPNPGTLFYGSEANPPLKIERPGKRNGGKGQGKKHKHKRKHGHAGKKHKHQRTAR